MMRKKPGWLFWGLVLAAFCGWTFGHAAAADRIAKIEVATQALVIRSSALEARHGVYFEKDRLPQLHFGLPFENSWIDWRKFNAIFDSVNQRIYLNPGFKPLHVDLRRFAPEIKSPRTAGLSNESLRQTLDHELGHVIADQLSRRLGRGNWLDPAFYETHPWYWTYGRRMQSEGVAEYFGQTGISNPMPVVEAAWPVKASELFFIVSPEYMIYWGGYALVKPILDAFGERGLVYILSEPFFFPDGNIRSAALAYQRRAFKELSKP